MSPLLLGILITLGGLAMIWFSRSPRMAGNPVLPAIVFYTGIALVVVGLILILFPVIAWAYAQLRAAFNV